MKGVGLTDSIEFFYKLILCLFDNPYICYSITHVIISCIVHSLSISEGKPGNSGSTPGINIYLDSLTGSPPICKNKYIEFSFFI